MKKLSNGFKKLTRRKLVSFGLIGSALSGIGLMSFLLNQEGRKVSGSQDLESFNQAEVDFDNLEYTGDSLPVETSVVARFVARVRFRKKLSEGHNTRYFSDISEYAP